MADGGLFSSISSPIVGAVCGWLGGGVSGFLSSRYERKQKNSIYSEPLVHAAFDLQSRIFNIFEQGFTKKYYLNGDDRSKEYYVENTSFLVAQLLCWFEITRQELFFIELNKKQHTQKLIHLQDKIHTTWGTDKAEYCDTLRIFAGEQRAIGENLVFQKKERSMCMGYAQFMESFPQGKNEQIDILRSEVVSLAYNIETARKRMINIQNYLIDILDLLDPECIRFPADSRKKINI
ncbi:hypothetical protein NKW43_02280 [Gluconobacter albidus]|uniref:hypothetical protein n=1 Tax=Gluconobacter albidus TaxID=318683 RepID=UPI00209D9DCD|nr:hypothetical protein [Gluconobacter albidus]MCP1272506.1 hypothetical protein [Gluconobacter albidus]